MTDRISHEAVVQSADADSVRVLLSPGVSCNGCRAEKSCGMAGSEAKEMVIPGSFRLTPGDKVVISMNLAQGYKALLLGYLLPLVIVVTSLIILVSLSFSELMAGIVSLLLLLPYYGLLLILRKTIGKRFKFTLNRIS